MSTALLRKSFAPWQLAVFDSALQAQAAGRLGHALLLVGPAHLGKHMVAEALAMRLLCPQPGADGFACGTCRSCKQFPAQQVGLLTTQVHADLQRVSFEPNDKGDKLRTEISVDQIRRLGHWFSLTPQLGGAKVAIVEPADALNHSAANALLKTLEEPAGNRFLLLVTSRPGRLPATIRSRCHRLEFRLPAGGDALTWLDKQEPAIGGAASALELARGNPGLAAHLLRNGELPVRAKVLQQLAAVGSGKCGSIEVAQAWLADGLVELRLRFAAELALEAAAVRLDAAAALPGGLAAPADFARLAAWFDAINRLREQLRAPLRHDLVLAGLLHEWRNMFEQGQPGAGPQAKGTIR